MGTSAGEPHTHDIHRYSADSLMLMAVCGLQLTTAGAVDAQRRGGHALGPPPVAVADVKIVPVNERIAAVGSGRARRRVTVATRYVGLVAKVLFEGGGMVKANQPLVQLHAETEQITVETAEAQRAQAADSVERLKQLSQGVVTRVARAEADTALKVTDAALRRAREEVDRMTTRAPFAGIMGLTNLQVGDYIGAGTAIARSMTARPSSSNSPCPSPSRRRSRRACRSARAS